MLLDFPIFHGLTVEELKDITACGCIHDKTYAKNAVIFQMGETTSFLGIVKSGHVLIENIDLWGNKTILSDVPTGHIFGETYALTGEVLMVSAVAASQTTACFLNIPLLTHPKFENRGWYLKMLRNLMLLSARKNLVLSSRIFHTSPKHVRFRLQSYLSSCCRKAGAAEFDIPFDRQQLADYLNLDRSAMSKELGRMREAGLLDYHKNHFRLFSGCMVS